MKKKLIALILAAMSITALAACGKKQDQKPSGGDDTPVDPQPGPGGDDKPEALPAEYSLMEHWAGNENEEAYAVTKQGENAVITYTDVTGEYAGGWEYVKRSFQYDTRASEFSVYKKILFKGKLEKTSGTDIVTFKVEGADKTHTYEKKFKFNSETRTYELGLNFIEDWTKVSQLLFFVNRETNESGSGKITLEKFVLSQEAVVPENDIAPEMPDIPQGYALYDGVPESGKVNIMHHWGYASGGHIETQETDGKYKFEWQGEKGEWEWVSSRIKNGEANLHESGLKRIVFEVTGTASHKATFKFESEQGGAVEKHVDLTGEAQVVEIDVTTLLVAEKTSFAAMIFPDGGQANVATKGEIVLSACYLDKTEVTPEVIPEVKNAILYPHAWLDKYDSADGCYTIENNEATHVTTIAFDHENAGENYKTIIYKMQLNEGDSWFGIANYRKVFAKLSADVDVQVLLKAYDKVEKRVDLVANVAQYVEFEVAEADVDINKPFVVFVGTSAASPKAGNVTIEGLRVARMNAVSEQSEGVARINAAAAGVNDGYTITKNSNGDMEIEWTATEPGYRAIEVLISTPNAAALNTIKAKLTSTADVHVMFKPADAPANETSVALQAGVERGVNRAFSGKALGDGWDSKFIMFICTSAGDALTGKVTFKDFRLTDGTHDAYDAVNDDPDPDPEYMNYANYQSLYLDKYKAEPEGVTIVNENHISTFTFENLAPSWAGVEYIGKLHSDIAWANVNDFSHFHAIFRASSAMKIMFKAFNDSALERTLELPADTDVPVDLNIPTEKLDFSKPSVLFVNPALDGAVAVTGTLTVKYMQFARQGVSFADGAEAVDLYNFPAEKVGNYSFSHVENKLVVSYEKENLDYDSFELYGTGHEQGYNCVDITVTSTAATRMIVKPLNNGANETYVTLEAGVEKSVKCYMNVPTNEMWGNVVFMIGYGGEDAKSATLTFTKLQLCKVQEIAVPQGTFYAGLQLTSAGKTTLDVGYNKIPVMAKIGQTISVSVNGDDAGATTVKSFNKFTGKVVLQTENVGDLSATYNPENGKLENFKFETSPYSGLIENNGYVSLFSAIKYWDCNGTTEELQAQWNRRYGDPWTLDTVNADKVTQDTVNAISGSGMKLRPYADNRFALATKDFSEKFNARNLSLWVYNPSESTVSIQSFAYKSTGYSNFIQPFGTMTIQPGWTYISAGFTATDLYGFQIFVNKTSVALTFDDIVLY